MNKISWTDKESIRVIKKLRDLFKVEVFIETGSHMGINAELHARHFNHVFTCEKKEKFYKKAKERLDKYSNVSLFLEDSSDFLKWMFRSNTPKSQKNKVPLIYLDAHFYDKTLPKKDRFQILKELRALKGKNCILVIHDFDNNLGHIKYDGITLDMDLLRKDLLNINPNFYFYTNTLASCDIMKVEETKDKEMIKNLKYTWSKPEKTYRGILYCLPKNVSIEGLREWN